MCDDVVAPSTVPPAEGESVFPSDDPVFTLHYFDLKALAEPIRYLFAYGKQAYEDVRVSRDEWVDLKPKMPMGQMPVLDIDGRPVHQSVSICRYLAKRFGLTGNTDYENLLIDTAVDTINDFRLKLAAASYEPDEEQKEKKYVKLRSEVIPFYLEKLEAVVKANNGHLALSRLTWADIYLAGIFDHLNNMAGSELLDNASGLQQLVKKVDELEPIRTWLEKRPVHEV